MNLYLGILAKQIVLYLIVGVIIDAIAPDNQSSFSLIFWATFAIVQSWVIYYQQIKAGDALGISKGHENYLKVRFNETFSFEKSEEQIIQDIKDTEQSLDKVYFNDIRIRKEGFRGFVQRSVSRITTSTKNGENYIEVSTRPLLPFVESDNYHNYKIFNKLKEIISIKVS